MLLAGKNAVIYGGGGAIGGAVARAFAKKGPICSWPVASLSPLESVAKDIRASGGDVVAAKVDALDERAVNEHFEGLVETAGHIDISFNLISVGDVQGTPLVDMTLDEFEQPIRNAVRSQFLTTRAAARHMIKQQAGVILTFGGGGGREPMRDYFIGGFQISLSAVDTLRRQLASELGQFGVRVVTIESGGVLETVPLDFADRDKITDLIIGQTMLKRAATFDDVGNVAVFAASDLARSMTGSVLNITCGATVD